jgi:hypothetical protein
VIGHGLEYVFLGKQLGGRPERSELDNADGSLDLELPLVPVVNVVYYCVD